MKRAAIEKWVDQHFSDNLQAQETIAKFTGALLVIAVVLMMVVIFLLLRGR